MPRKLGLFLGEVTWDSQVTYSYYGNFLDGGHVGKCSERVGCQPLEVSELLSLEIGRGCFLNLLFRLIAVK